MGRIGLPERLAKQKKRKDEYPHQPAYYSAWRTLDPLVNQGAHILPGGPPGGPRIYQGAHSVQNSMILYFKNGFKTLHKQGECK